MLRTPGSVLPLSSDAGFEGGALDGGDDALDDLPVEDARDDVFKTQFARGNAAGNGARGSLFHVALPVPGLIWQEE